MAPSQPFWDEENSAAFIDYGRYFVPDREDQMQIICDLIPPTDKPFIVMELSHGEGLLAAAILDRFPMASVYGYDISAEMRRTARQKLARFGDRFQTHYFDLLKQNWRSPAIQPQAVVTSLTVHHLDGPGKQRLFADMYRLLVTGGALIIADLIEPAHPLAKIVAEEGWDTAVRERAHQLGGGQDVFDEFENMEWNLYRHPDPEVDKPSRLFDQLKWLEQAGFAAIDVFWMRAGHAIFGGYKI